MQLRTKGLADSSRRSYKVATKRYLQFCAEASLSPFPVRERELELFVAWSAKQGLAHSSVKSYLAAVWHSRGWGDPGMAQMPGLELTLRSLKRVQAEQGRQQRERRPITVEILLKIRRVWQKQSGWQPEMLPHCVSSGFSARRSLRCQLKENMMRLPIWESEM